MPRRVPIQQCLGYVKEEGPCGRCTHFNGRNSTNHRSTSILYVLADLTKTMIERCEFANLNQPADGLGYFGFNEGRKAYTSK